MKRDQFQQMRREYIHQAFQESDAAEDPLMQFQRWFEQAIDNVVDLPNAMTLATVSAEGVPSARVVLLKHYDQKGFQFFTNYESNKGKDLKQNPRASLLFYWSLFDRQIRIQGSVEKMSRAASVSYFESRPIDSQISAAISAQSHQVPNREALEKKFAACRQAINEGKTLETPHTWGGYCLKPTQFEFWQGRENRLHDRLAYSQQDGKWKITRLAP